MIISESIREIPTSKTDGSVQKSVAVYQRWQFREILKIWIAVSKMPWAWTQFMGTFSIALLLSELESIFDQFFLLNSTWLWIKFQLLHLSS